MLYLFPLSNPFRAKQSGTRKPTDVLRSLRGKALTISSSFSSAASRAGQFSILSQTFSSVPNPPFVFLVRNGHPSMSDYIHTVYWHLHTVSLTNAMIELFIHLSLYKQYNFRPYWCELTQEGPQYQFIFGSLCFHKLWVWPKKNFVARKVLDYDWINTEVVSENTNRD